MEDIKENAKPAETFSDSQFWAGQWDKRDIGFHKTSINPFLEKFIDQLIVDKEKKRILIPLCGKTVDMVWLASLGHDIVGVEFVKTAIQEFFAENNIKFHQSQIDSFKVFTSEDKRIKIYNGDFFEFNSKYEQPFDCVWDRGAYGALPHEIRLKYPQHIFRLLKPNFRYILNVWQYDKSIFSGPPHSVPDSEINETFGPLSQIKYLVAEDAISSRFEGNAKEVNFLLLPLNQ